MGLHSETRTLATIQSVNDFRLESGALDRSAILTAHSILKCYVFNKYSTNTFSETLLSYK